MNRPLILAALLFTLGACGKGKEQTSAGGEILPGSTSDAMLPLDTVRSQAPLAPQAEASGKVESGEASDAASDAAEPEATASDAAAPAKPSEAPTVE